MNKVLFNRRSRISYRLIRKRARKVMESINNKDTHMAALRRAKLIVELASLIDNNDKFLRKSIREGDYNSSWNDYHKTVFLCIEALRYATIYLNDEIKDNIV